MARKRVVSRTIPTYFCSTIVGNLETNDMYEKDFRVIGVLTTKESVRKAIQKQGQLFPNERIVDVKEVTKKKILYSIPERVFVDLCVQQGEEKEKEEKE